MRFRWPSVSLWGWVVLVGACAGTFRDPYTARDLARDSEKRQADALVHYFAQAHADPEVCDPARSGAQSEPRLGPLEPGSIDDLVDALAHGELRSDLLGECLAIGLVRWEAANRRRAVSRLADAYLAALRERQSSHAVRSVLRGLLLRREAAPPGPDALQDLADELAGVLAQRDLDAEARSLAAEWWAALEFGRDRYAGRPLTPPAIHGFDDATLQLAASRLARRELRDEAQVELVQRRIRTSDYAAVRDDGEAVLVTVLSSGGNAIDLQQHPILRLWLAPDQLPSHLVVRQDLARGQARLLAALPGGRQLESHLSLSRRLWFAPRDISPAVTLCEPSRTLDPTPCVARRDVEIGGLGLHVDAGGALHLSDELPIAELVRLARVDGVLALALRAQLAGLTTDHAIALRFDAPDPVLVVAADSGAAGPDLDVLVEELGDHWVFEVASAEQRWYAVLDASAPGKFAIASRGAQGMAGRSGSDGPRGAAGSSGSNASCPSSPAGDGQRGGDGGRGGDGQDGGHGGAGGDIHVHVSCASGACPALVEWLRSIVRSEPGGGGVGGHGGSGGSGGSGGRGGSGTTCTVQQFGSTRTEHLSGGHDGMSGSSGWSGSSGRDGLPGRPGRVSVEMDGQVGRSRNVKQSDGIVPVPARPANALVGTTNP